VTAKAPKKFYQSANVEPLDGEYTIVLDGRPVRTPMKTKLSVPSERLAAAIALEWDTQKNVIDLNSMPMTGFASATLDRIQPRRADVVAEISGYAETDLLCYRAEAPAELVERQETLWTPHLEWLAKTHDVRLATTVGIAPISQSVESLERIRTVVGHRDAFGLTALQVLTMGTGSVVLGLAVADGYLDAAGAYAAGQLDEIYQAEVWGEDPPATERRTKLARDLADAERFLELQMPQA